MPFGWGEHTGELQLWVTAPTEEEVFVEALNAVNELLGDDETQKPAEERRVRIEAGDRAGQFAEFIEELAFLAEVEGFVPERARDVALDARGLQATVTGHLASPPHLIKAVTYHRLRFERVDQGWRAEAVIDV